MSARDTIEDTLVRLRGSKHHTVTELTDHLLAALAAAELKVVPVVPTDEMLDAGVAASETQRVGPIYRAMVEAADPLPRGPMKEEDK